MGESRLRPAAAVSRFQMTHQKTLLEPQDNMEELLELRNGDFNLFDFSEVLWSESTRERGTTVVMEM